MSPANPLATVVAVCLSPDPGVPKHPQPQVTVGPHGILGDFHAVPIAKHAGRDANPNLRQISIVAQEAVDDVCAALGVTIPPGGLGENILVRGLGDLGQLQPGQRLRFSSGVEVEVTAQNNPCKNLSVYHPQAVKHFYGKRGVVAVVKTPGLLRPGDTVTLV